MIYGTLADREGALTQYLLKAMGSGLYVRVQSALDSFGKTNLGILSHLTESDGVSGRTQLNELAGQHYRELLAFADAHNALAMTPLEISEQVEDNRLARELTKKPGVDASQTYRNIVGQGLRMAVVVANCLYGRAERDGFLSNLKGGVVNHDYMEQQSKRVVQGNT